MPRKVSMLLTNAVSFNMFNTLNVELTSHEVSVNIARELLLRNGMESGLGHQDAATGATAELGFDAPYCRANTCLEVTTEPHQFLVYHRKGMRLVEGAMVAPEGSQYTWLLVTYQQPS